MPVPGYGGHYEASSLGRVRSKARTVLKRHKGGAMMQQRYGERILKPTLQKGYPVAHISVENRKQNARVSHLVLEAWRGPRPDGMLSCHEDDDPLNNRPGNLRWDTHTGNMQDRKRAGNYATGSAHPMAKFSDELVAAIRAGEVSCSEAVGRGVSKTHYYRLARGR